MAYVSAELMEATWHSVGASGADHVLRMQKRHQKIQKALCRYVYSQFLEDLREDAAGVGLYAYHVLLEAFLSARPGLRPIRKPAINRTHESLTVSGPYADLVSASPEPHALQYVHDVLFDPPDDDDVVLSGEEAALCWQVLHTVVLCLHEARAR